MKTLKLLLALILAALAALMPLAAGAVCQQTGYLVQAELTPTGAATFYLMPNPTTRVAYSYTTESERLIGALTEKTEGSGGVRVTLIGDAPQCPGIGPTRPAGVIARVITGE